jgi:hypothetical protein
VIHFTLGLRCYALQAYREESGGAQWSLQRKPLLNEAGDGPGALATQVKRAHQRLTSSDARLMAATDREDEGRLRDAAQRRFCYGAFPDRASLTTVKARHAKLAKHWRTPTRTASSWCS